MIAFAYLAPNRTLQCERDNRATVVIIGYAAIGNYILSKCIKSVAYPEAQRSHYVINSSASNSITGIKYHFIEIRSNSRAL